MNYITTCTAPRKEFIPNLPSCVHIYRLILAICNAKTDTNEEHNYLFLVGGLECSAGNLRFSVIV